MGQQPNRMYVIQMLRFLESCHGTPDGVLLERFVRTGDEEAFNALLRRYGGMVWGVCRRITRTPQDAEDAFQAVFLVLLRRASTLHSGRPLGAWLYSVAVRVSRAASRRRIMAALPAEDLLPAVPATEPTADWLSFVDLEVQRLPERYRAAFILCEIEGRSRQEAAGLLCVPEGTLSSRLAMAKKRLAKRLSARGLPAVGLGSLAWGLGAQAAPASLQRLTAAAGLHVLRDPRAWPALLPASVVTLTHGVTGSMFSTTWKVISLSVFMLGLAGAVLVSGMASTASGAARDANAAPSALVTPNPEAVPPADDEALEAWLLAQRERLLNEGKDTARIDRWLAEVRRGMKPPERKPPTPPGRSDVDGGAGDKSKPGTAEFYQGVYGQGRGTGGVKMPSGPPGVGGDGNRQGLFIPTPDGGWMDVGERILSLERELRETRRQLNELKKAMDK
jgi:RNA polymerase sigma factor (sigma-70 family)